MFQNHTHTHDDPRRHRRDPRRGPDGSPFGFREAFGGGRGRGGMVRRGEIRPLILAVLATKPMHGYEVITELEAQSGGRWRPSAGSVYPTLQQLADEGLVTSEEIDGRRVYALTDEGKAAAAAGPALPLGRRRPRARQRRPPPGAPGRRGRDPGAASGLAQRRDRGPGDPPRHARQAVRPARRRLGTPPSARRRRAGDASRRTGLSLVASLMRAADDRRDPPLRPAGPRPGERPVAAQEQPDRQRGALHAVVRQRAAGGGLPCPKISENRIPPSSSEAALGDSSGSGGPASAKQRTTGSWSSSIAAWSC